MSYITSELWSVRLFLYLWRLELIEQVWGNNRRQRSNVYGCGLAGTFDSSIKLLIECPILIGSCFMNFSLASTNRCFRHSTISECYILTFGSIVIWQCRVIHSHWSDSFFSQTLQCVREFCLWSSPYWHVIRQEIVEIHSLHYDMSSLSYFNLIGRVRLCLQISRGLLQIPLSLLKVAKDQHGHHIVHHLKNIKRWLRLLEGWDPWSTLIASYRRLAPCI